MKKDLSKAVDDLFTAYVEANYNTARLVNLSRKGLYQISVGDKLVEALKNYRNQYGRDLDDGLVEQAKDDATFAKAVMTKEFSELFAQGTIWIWAQFEAFFEDLLVTCLEKHPELFEHEKVKNIKIPLHQYDSLSPPERRYFLIEELQRQVAGNLRQGADRYENVLKLLKLGGPIRRDVKKNLYEMSSIRNTLVHRRGIVDRILIQACPWLNLKLDSPLIVTNDSFSRYSFSLVIYAAVIVKRLTKYCGEDVKAIEAFLKAMPKFKC